VSALVLVEGPLSEALLGPEMRAVGLARTLSAHMPVTLAAHRESRGEHDGLPVIPFRRRTLLHALGKHRLVVAPWVPPYLYLAAGPQHRFVADLYDPMDLELGGAPAGRSRVGARQLHAFRALLDFQRRHADALLCANSAQEERLRALGEEGGPVPLTRVPFGMDEAPSSADGAALRRRLPGVRPEDPIILWWGSLWPWLDAQGAVAAMHRLRESRPRAQLVFTAAAPLGRRSTPPTTTQATRALAARLGVLDRTVRFLDEWIPFAQRDAILGDADIGLTLHRDDEEARYAVRARILDYLWMGLPCVLSGGDELSLELIHHGAALEAPTADPGGCARALDSLLDPNRRADAAAASAQLRARHRWSAIDDALLGAVQRALDTPPRRRSVLGHAARYYAGRAMTR
jgi:glycosyltransferase involved in cell wall biosynthesis